MLLHLPSGWQLDLFRLMTLLSLLPSLMRQPLVYEPLLFRLLAEVSKSSAVYTELGLLTHTYLVNFFNILI